MEPTNRFTNRLTALVRMDRDSHGRDGTFTAEALGPGYDVTDLTRGGIPPQVTVTAHVNWPTYPDLWWPDLRMTTDTSPEAEHDRRTRRLARIAADVLTDTGHLPSPSMTAGEQAAAARVLEAMLPYLTSAYGNPASPHAHGRQADQAVRAARRQLRDLIGASADSEIVFTSGATEANHLAITGIARAAGGAGSHVITTAIEHKAVLAACEHLAGQGFQVTVIPPGADGLVDPADVATAITPDTVLVSVMHANNEIGTIQPLAEISQITRDRSILLHTDAAQSLGAVAFGVDHLGIDLASFSGHKIYGPKGIGALYIRRGTVRPVPQISGGGQEYGLRPGTLNVPGIVGIGEAATILASECRSDAYRIANLRDQLLARLHEAIPGIRVNGSPTRRLPGNLNITIPGINADALIEQLPGLAISTGSACNTGLPEPSHVLTAIGLDRQAARSSIRIGLGRGTTPQDITAAARQVTEAIHANAVNS